MIGPRLIMLVACPRHLGLQQRLPQGQHPLSWCGDSTSGDRPKGWRRVATRYDRYPKILFFAVALASAVILGRIATSRCLGEHTVV